MLRGLRVGEPVARESTILKVVDKAGASGRLLFVTVGHETTDKAGIAIREEQDLVYQAASNTAVPPEPAAEPIAGSHRESAAIDSTLLFRYSALTGNGHRIHYDRDYAVNEEGYAGLVVHGPLQAILLANLARRLRADRELTEFAFRGRRPALLHQCPLGLEAWQEGSALLLRTVNTHGTVCTTATARFA